MERTPPQAQATPMTNITTSSETFYTPSEYDKIIPATQYTSQSKTGETQSKNQHALLIQALDNAITETKRLQVKGGNIVFKANLTDFPQEAMSIAQSLLPTIVAAQPHCSETPQHNQKLNATQDDQDLRREMTNMNNDLKEIKALLAKAPHTWAQVVAYGEETEKPGLPPNYKKPSGE